MAILFTITGLLAAYLFYDNIQLENERTNADYEVAELKEINKKLDENLKVKENEIDTLEIELENAQALKTEATQEISEGYGEYELGTEGSNISIPTSFTFTETANDRADEQNIRIDLSDNLFIDIVFWEHNNQELLGIQGVIQNNSSPEKELGEGEEFNIDGKDVYISSRISNYQDYLNDNESGIAYYSSLNEIFKEKYPIDDPVLDGYTSTIRGEKYDYIFATFRPNSSDILTIEELNQVKALFNSIQW